MTSNSCELIVEIRYGGDQSYDAVTWMENALRERAEALLAPLSPAYADMRGTGDDFGFVAQVLAWEADDLRGICRGLSELMDVQGQGRMVAVPGGLGPVSVWRFTFREVVEARVPEEI